MPSKSKRKGYLLEHFCVKELRELGFDVERLGQAHQADFVINDIGWVGECKVRSKGIKSIYDWLGDSNEMLVIKWQSRKARGKEPLVVLRWSDFKELLKDKV